MVIVNQVGSRSKFLNIITLCMQTQEFKSFEINHKVHNISFKATKKYILRSAYLYCFL